MAVMCVCVFVCSHLRMIVLKRQPHFASRVLGLAFPSLLGLESLHSLFIRPKKKKETPWLELAFQTRGQTSVFCEDKCCSSAVKKGESTSPPFHMHSRCGNITGV